MKILRRVDDRTLLRVAWLAPLLLIALNQWRSSLETPYLPPRVATAELSLAKLQPALAHWMQATGKFPDAVHLVAIVTADCPCTEPALEVLRREISNAGLPATTLEVVTVRPRTEARAQLHAEVQGVAEREALHAVLAQVPATPTLLFTVAGRLHYAGPITEGGACGAAVKRLLARPLTGSDSNTAPSRNIAAQGCYCRLAPAMAKAG